MTDPGERAQIIRVYRGEAMAHWQARKALREAMEEIANDHDEWSSGPRARAAIQADDEAPPIIPRATLFSHDELKFLDFGLACAADDIYMDKPVLEALRAEIDVALRAAAEEE